MSCRSGAPLGAMLAIALVAGGCGYRLPGAMGPKMTPEEMRQRHGDSAKYLLEEPSAAAAELKARQAAAAAKKDSGEKLPARASVANTPLRQLALAPKGVQEAAQPAGTRFGNLFFISGQLPTDVRGHPTADTRVEEQTRLAMENLRAILEANQMSMENVLSTTVHLRDLKDLKAFDSIYSSYFKGAMPARSVVQVAGLPNDAKVEISAVAGK